MEMWKSLGGRISDRARIAELQALHERFIAGELDPWSLDSAEIRPVVAASWRRSLATGVDPDFGAAPDLVMSSNLTRIREAHPLAPALPLIRRLLVEDAEDSGVVVAVMAADGTLLWVEGDSSACRKAGEMNFVAGADWSERGAGTNAPGTAVALDSEMQIRSSEHFSRAAQPWSCTAVPVHDPATGAILGAIDLTGGTDVASPGTLALVRATALAVEKHLALARLVAPGAVDPTVGNARFKVMGVDRPTWQLTGERGQTRTVPLSPRHADILVLLMHHPEGLGADQLALLLDDKDLDVGTVRAEVSRMRRALPGLVGSRPYRLLGPIKGDLSSVLDALKAGEVVTALDHYTGALLPRSMSPAIARLRSELSATLRGAVVASGDTALLRRWLELPEGRDDRDGWWLLHNSSEVGSMGRAQARGHLVALDLDLG
ncbi:MAG: GAF domain-containing protein [Mycobacterium sp.]